MPPKTRSSKHARSRRNRKVSKRSKRHIGGDPAQELFDAIFEKNNEKVEEMLQSNIDLLNSRSDAKVRGGVSRKGMSPLTAACYAKNEEVLMIFLIRLDLSNERILELASERDSFQGGKTPIDLAHENPKELWGFYDSVRILKDIELENQGLYRDQNSDSE